MVLFFILKSTSVANESAHKYKSAFAGSMKGLNGKPKAYRTVLRQSRLLK